jgi:hypothetical protein
MPIARLVQGDSQRDAILQKDRMVRFQYDFSLLSVLLDHWSPETHTFHFTGHVAADGPSLWGRAAEGREHLRWLAYGVSRSVRERSSNDCAPAAHQEFANAHGPTLSWLQQFSVHTFT